MGNDGGSIPTRDELVRLKKKPEQKNKESERVYKWQHCHLSQEPLLQPIVACEMGRMYNKVKIIEMLMDNNRPDIVKHIRSLRDVRELVLTDNPALIEQDKLLGRVTSSGGYHDSCISSWICPIVGLEMNGRFKFVFDWSSGRVMSERACKFLKNSKDELDTGIKPENVVILNPDDNTDDWSLMANRMEVRRSRSKTDKKNKKRKSLSASDVPPIKKTVTNLSSLSSSSSIQNDPHKSQVFKSLFSTHSSAINTPKAHWVTFDPRYN